MASEQVCLLKDNVRETDLCWEREGKDPKACGFPESGTIPAKEKPSAAQGAAFESY